MNFAITFKNIRSDSETIGYIDHRLAFAFAHAPHRIQEAKITLSDLSDPWPPTELGGHMGSS